MVVVLKEPVVLKELLLEDCDIFSIFSAVNVESKVLINLESVNAIIWSREKGGKNEGSFVPKPFVNCPITGSEARYTKG